VQPGQIYRHDRFYRNSETGELEPKYLVFLARAPSGDWVARLLTSQAHARPEQPPCHHGDPYPGYFLGVPDPPLTRKTWVDLRALSDVDPFDVRDLVDRGVMAQVSRLPVNVLIAVLECTAGANDTTVQQERALRDQLSLLR
jgi:hypothetical protein